MHWGERAFVAKIVLGEGKVLDGWPAHVPFGALTRIPGGLRTVLELLARWDAGTMRRRRALGGCPRRQGTRVGPRTPLGDRFDLKPNSGQIQETYSAGVRPQHHIMLNTIS